MTAPRITLEEVQAFEWPFRLRLPFRFGVITVTHGRQAVLRARIRLESGRTAEGMAAETLAAKWFDKDPALTDEQNEHQLRRAIEIACDAYRTAGSQTPFGLFANSYAEVMARAATERLPPLVAGFGPALLDRAILDAVLRAQGVSFATGMRANIAGMTPHPVIADLDGFDWDRFLASLAPRRHRCTPHRRPGRPDHGCGPAARVARGGRAARDAGGGVHDLSPHLLQAEGRRRRCRRCRPPLPHRRGAGPSRSRLSRHARRQRAVRGCRGCARAVARDRGGTAARHAARLGAVHRAAGETRHGARRRHGAARRAPRGDRGRAMARWTPSSPRGNEVTAVSPRRPARASTRAWSTSRAAGRGTRPRAACATS